MIISEDVYSGGIAVLATDRFVYLKPDVAVVSDLTATEAGIQSNIANSTFLIGGTVMGYYALRNTAGNGLTTINVLDGGALTAARHAIYLTSSQLVLENHGTISALRAYTFGAGPKGTIYSNSAAANDSIVNYGVIAGVGDPAIALGGGDDVVRNSGMIDGDILLGIGADRLFNDGTIRGRILLEDGGAGAPDFVENSGTITGSVIAGTGNGSSVVRNFGMIRGSVHLSGGGGTYDGRGGGIVTDRVYGGAGNDYYAIDRSTTIIDNSGDNFVLSSVNFTLTYGLHRLQLAGEAVLGRGGTGADAIYGNELDNRLVGDGGDDLLEGRDGDDSLVGGAGMDALSGGAGDDMLGGGIGDDVLRDDEGSNTIAGGAGYDRLDLTATSLSVIVDLTAGTMTLPSGEVSMITGVESVMGGSGVDTLSGDALANRLDGGDGADKIAGLVGNDVLIGGLGNDRLDGGLQIDTVSYADALAVTANLTTRIATVTVDVPRTTNTDTLIAIENLIGSRFADTLTGDIRANALDGGDGDDKLLGGVGDDRLAGGAGDDELTGGAGADVFVFADVEEEGGGFGADEVLDFTPNQDKVDLSGVAEAFDYDSLQFDDVAQGVLQITFESGDTILLYGVNSRDVSPMDFIFHG